MDLDSGKGIGWVERVGSLLWSPGWFSGACPGLPPTIGGHEIPPQPQQLSGFAWGRSPISGCNDKWRFGWRRCQETSLTDDSGGHQCSHPRAIHQLSHKLQKQKCWLDPKQYVQDREESWQKMVLTLLLLPNPEAILISFQTAFVLFGL